MENNSRNVKFVSTLSVANVWMLFTDRVSPGDVCPGKILSTAIEIMIQTSNIIVTLQRLTG